jgi:uncharacterized membrane protein
MTCIIIGSISLGLCVILYFLARKAGRDSVKSDIDNKTIKDLLSDVKINTEFDSLDLIAARQRMRDKIKKRVS